MTHSIKKLMGGGIVISLVFIALASCKPEEKPTPSPAPSPTPTPTPTPTPPPALKDYVKFEDSAFKTYILSNFDTDKNGEIDQDEASKVTDINCPSLGIKSLSGIRCFTSLKTLNCSGNALTSLVLGSGTTKGDVAEGNLSVLVGLDCSNNQIGSLNVVDCKELKTINTSENKLVKLDLSANTKLQDIDVSHNQLTSVDLSKNQAATIVDVSYNKLTSVDLSGNTQLKDIDVSHNQLTSIDLSKNKEILKIDVSDNNLQKVDLSANTKLEVVNATGNKNLEAVVVTPGSKAEIKIDAKPEVKDVAVTSVSLSKTSLELTEGETSSISATVSPSNATNKSVKWGSSDTKVATVDASGKVTAVAPGTASVTVTTADGGKTAECKVVVKAKVIAVTSISLNKTSLELTEGETSSISATVSPSNATNKSVKWGSSDTKVVTVDASGKVTAVAPGTASVTVTTADGGKTAECKVVVKAKVIAVTSISLDKTSASLSKGATLQLVATVGPQNATDKTIIWTSSDESVASVSSSGLVTAKIAGTATITAKAGDKTAVCKVIVISTGGSGTEEIVDNGEKHEWK